MGTRGAIGFIAEGKEYVTYNHFDSYPSHLGNEMVKFCSENRTSVKLKALKEAVKKIVLVGNEKPTVAQIRECKKFTNLDVSEKSIDDWYCLLREAQGTLNPYLGNLRYMIDSKDFLTDSLFCEYAYLINLDTGKLEFYKGFNKDPNANGRYAKTKAQDMGYVGVVLVKEYDIKGMTKKSVSDIVQDMEKLISDDGE